MTLEGNVIANYIILFLCVLKMYKYGRIDNKNKR